MNGLRVFESKDFGSVRVMSKKNEPWFVAIDVCKALGIQPTAIRRLDADEKITQRLTQGESNRTSDTTVINEPGLYSLVLGSRKPEAKAFKRWITHDVIPAIRKTGGYIAGEETMSDDELLSRALQVAAMKLKQREEVILELQLENASLSYANHQLQAKANYFDAAMDSKLLTGIRETAKLFGIKQNQLVQFLLSTKYAYRNGRGQLLPYENKNRGYFAVKEVQNQQTGWFIIMFMFTPKGRAYFHRILYKYNSDQLLLQPPV